MTTAPNHAHAGADNVSESYLFVFNVAFISIKCLFEVERWGLLQATVHFQANWQQDLSLVPWRAGPWHFAKSFIKLDLACVNVGEK